jgi:multidrug resistance efflux pump
VRLLRLFVGLAVVVFAVWVIVGEQITGVSSDAVVNARLTTVRAPIAGTLDMPMRAFGEVISEAEILATVTDPRVDEIRLHDLQMEKMFVAAQIAAQIATMTATDAEIATLEGRAATYQNARTQEVDVRIKRAQERVALLGLQASGAVAAANADSFEGSRALEELETLTISRDTIVQNIFLGDGYNDAPVTGQRIFERAAYRASLDTGLAELQNKATAIDQRIAQEAARVALLASADLVAPSEGVLWEVLADNGETVQRGQDVLRLMKCDSALVTLSVPDNVYNSLRVGQVATFRLDGTKELYEGVITRIAGSGAETIYRNLAVAPSIKHLERYDVALRVPALRDETITGCTVGQTGRVFFETRPLDRVRSILN